MLICSPSIYVPFEVVELKAVIRGAFVATTIAALSAKFFPEGIVVVASALPDKSLTVPTT